MLCHPPPGTVRPEGNEQEGAGGGEVLVEAVRRHEALHSLRHLPVAVGDGGGREGEEHQRQRAGPAQAAAEDHGAGEQLHRDGGGRRGAGQRQAEMPRLRHRAGIVEQLVQPALEISRAEPEQAEEREGAPRRRGHAQKAQQEQPSAPQNP